MNFGGVQNRPFSGRGFASFPGTSGGPKWGQKSAVRQNGPHFWTPGGFCPKEPGAPLRGVPKPGPDDFSLFKNLI